MRDLGKVAILSRNWLFRWGWFFLGGDLKIPCIKKGNINLKQKKKKKKKEDSDCNFYNFSLLVHYRNKFVVVCICNGINWAKFFSYLVALGWEYFKFLGDFLYWGVLISFLGVRARPFSSIKPSVTNHLNSRTIDGKIICFMCACWLFTLLPGIFLLRIFCLFKCPLKLQKNCLPLLGTNSVKVWIPFDMSSK